MEQMTLERLKQELERRVQQAKDLAKANQSIHCLEPMARAQGMAEAYGLCLDLVLAMSCDWPEAGDIYD
jgi:hypothetical protein